MAASNIPDDALPIATDAALNQGLSLADWVMRAISEQAAREQGVEQIPYDDCGFYSPYSTPAVAEV